MKNIIYITTILILASSNSFSQICPGEEGKLVWEAYFNTFDDEVGQLTALSDFPNNPDVTKTIYKTQSPVNYSNYFGGRYRGFLNVPTATDVVFNITGDDGMVFYLSPDNSPANKNLEAYIDGWTSTLEHDKYQSQTSDTISLQPGID